LYAFQAGSDPLAYSAGTWAKLKDVTSYGGPTGVSAFNPSCAMGYYGRLWTGGVAAEKDVVYYSDTLIGHEWRQYGPDGASGGGDDTSAGYVDLKTVWGQDEIVAIAPFYGKLVIFGKHNIVIYNGPAEPTTMELDEVIRGVGCVSRDSVQAVGDDLYFCSNTGVRSLHRTSELDKLPLVALVLQYLLSGIKIIILPQSILSPSY
jgi:hypothetical protein